MATPNIFQNKKLAVFVLLAIAVAAIFFLREDVTGFFAGQGQKTILVSATLTTAFDASIRADTLVIQFKAPSADVFVGGEKLEVLGQQDIELKFEGYKGKIFFEGQKLTLKGYAKKSFVNNVGRTAKREDFSVQTKELVTTAVKLSGATFPSFSSQSVSGSLDLNSGKTLLKLDSELLRIGAFSGDIELTDSIKLSGAISRISAKGIDINANAGMKEAPKPAETPAPTPAPTPTPAPEPQANTTTNTSTSATTTTSTTSSSGLTAEEIAQCGGPSVPVDECKKFLGKK
jgi:hypothetical protein